MGSSPEPAVPAYRRLRMPRKHPQLLGADLNKPLSGLKSQPHGLRANERLTVFASVSGGARTTCDATFLHRYPVFVAARSSRSILLGALFVGGGGVSVEGRVHSPSRTHVRRQQAAARPSRAASEWRKLAHARPQQARRRAAGRLDARAAPADGRLLRRGRRGSVSLGARIPRVGERR